MSSLRVICYDGADFTGKTTSCINTRNAILAKAGNSAIIMMHFPIRNLNTDIEMVNTDIKPEIFQLCDKLSGKSMIEIQDTIAANIEANSRILLETLSIGNEWSLSSKENDSSRVTVIIDRFIYSNIVYRRMYCGQTIVFDEFMKNYKYASRIMESAEINILTESIEELITRKMRRYSTEQPDEGTIDMINEENENINRANEEFKKFIS